MSRLQQAVLGIGFLLCSHGLPAMAQERAGEVLKQFEQRETAPKALPDQPVLERKGVGDRPMRRITPGDTMPIPVNKVVVEDAQGLLSPDEAAVAGTAEGKQQTLADLQGVADELTAVLRSKGYLTSYAYIPPQEIKDGRLIIRIMAGTLGQVTVSGNKNYGGGFIRGHLDTLRDKGPLTDKALIEQLLILNEQPFLNVRAALKAGAATGTSDMALTAQDRRPLFGSLTYDNYGNKTISKDRLSASLGAGNLLFDGDLVTLSGSLGLKKPDLDTLAYGRVEYGTPLNYSGTRLAVYYANNVYRAGGSLALLDLNGKAHVAGIRFTHPLVRRLADSLTVKAGFEYKDIDDYILGSLNSRDRIRTLVTGLDYDGADRFGGRNALSLGGIVGLEALVGGTEPSDTGSSRADGGGGFYRLTLDLLRDQELGGGHRLVLRAGGQYSGKELLVAEQFSVGGPYSVRGYRPSLRSGDSGYTTSAELHLALVKPAMAEAGGFLPNLGTLSLFLVPFVDHGGVYRNDPQAGESLEAHLTSVGTGVRIGSGGLAARIDWAVPERGGWRLGDSMTTIQVTAAF